MWLPTVRSADLTGFCSALKGRQGASFFQVSLNNNSNIYLLELAEQLKYFRIRKDLCGEEQLKSEVLCAVLNGAPSFEMFKLSVELTKINCYSPHV